MPDSTNVNAASNPDVSILGAALSQTQLERHGTRASSGRWSVDGTARGPNAFYDRVAYGHYTSALIEAIKVRSVETVESLLAKGVDPDGIPLMCMDNYSTSFIRRPLLQRRKHSYSHYSPCRSLLMQEASLPQSGAPTQEELEERRKMFVPFYFWANNRHYYHSRLNAAEKALEVAAKVGDLEIVEKLLDRNADISFWTAPSQLGVPDPPIHSSLSASNPLVVAIQEGHTPVIQRLLSAGFNPNVYQSSTPTICVTPLMVTVTLKDHAAGACCFDILVQQSKHSVDLTVRTPIFGINILHLAVASLSLPLIKTIVNHSSTLTTCKTALQHSLMHIACLPLDESHINWQSLAIATSIKDVRTLDLHWHPELPPASYSLLDSNDKVELDLVANSSLALPQPIDYFEDQCEVIKFLLGCQGQAVDSRDLYENTPLHYLASYRRVNMAALELLLETQEGQEAWMEAENE